MILRPTKPVVKAWTDLREERLGIMLHYDASASDPGGLSWLISVPAMGKKPVGYNVYILDDGKAYEIVPLAKAAYHAGVCKTSDPARLRYAHANSAFYGVAIAATDGDVVTRAQFDAVVDVCRSIAASHGWDLEAEPWRIVGHASECWPRKRKTDPEGTNAARPVLSVEAVRVALRCPAPPPPPAA